MTDTPRTMETTMNTEDKPAHPILHKVAGVIAVLVVASLAVGIIHAVNSSSNDEDASSLAGQLSQLASQPAAQPGDIPGEGTYMVGTDVQPGTYQAPGPDGAITGCYWARLSGLSGSTGDIIANQDSKGPVVVTIESTDIAFQTSGICGTWQRVS